MIPTLLVAGLVAGLFGRRGWWFVIIAALVWPVVLVVTDFGSSLAVMVGGAALAIANAAVGVALGLAVRWMVASVRSHA